MVYLFRADTPNFRTEAAKKIAELFPETVIDGKIDLESLEELLNKTIKDFIIIELVLVFLKKHISLGLFIVLLKTQ